MNPWAKHLRDLILSGDYPPAVVLIRLQFELTRGAITEQEFRDLVDMPLNGKRTNAPGGAC